MELTVLPIYTILGHQKPLDELTQKSQESCEKKKALSTAFEIERLFLNAFYWFKAIMLVSAAGFITLWIIARVRVKTWPTRCPTQNANFKITVPWRQDLLNSTRNRQHQQWCLVTHSKHYFMLIFLWASTEADMLPGVHLPCHLLVLRTLLFQFECQLVLNSFSVGLRSSLTCTSCS